MSESFRLCAKDELASGESRRFEIAKNESVCLVRIGDDFYAIGDTCSHEDYSLAEGDLFEDELSIECWRHGSAFSLKTGEPNSLPATKPVPVYDVTIAGDDVLVERAS